MPKPTSRTLLKRAEKLARLGDLVGAFDQYMLVLDQWPKNAQAGAQQAAIVSMLAQQQPLYHAKLTRFLQAADFEPGLQLANQIDQAFAHDADIANISAALHLAAGRNERAVELFERACDIEPNNLKFLTNLGSAHRAMRNTQAAAKCFRKALDLQPDDAETLWKLGLIEDRLGDTAAARARFHRACELDPNQGTFEWARLTTAAQFHDSREAISSEYRLIRENLDTANSLDFELEQPACSEIVFSLAYSGLPNRGLLSQHSAILREKCAALRFERPSTTGTADDRRIKIGICSDYLRNHTIGKLFVGHVKQIDRSRFTVTVIHPPAAKRDEFSQSVDAAADHVLRLSGDLRRQQTAIAELDLDCLFYPDIGMSPNTFFLAHARLALVQAVSWGHPDTTGIDTIDYFISSDLIEPEGAETDYAERLVKLNRLPCHYTSLPHSTEKKTRDTLGLPMDGRLYGCPQSLFKFHPDFDPVLAEIIQRDPDAWIVLIEGQEQEWSAKLKARWEANHPSLTNRVLFLPRLNYPDFMALIDQCHVLLDTLHFGSGNTLYEAMQVGTPIITYPGRFMRGRCVYGAYKQMKVVDAPIAHDINDYARLAVELANDPARLGRMQDSLRTAAQEHLYEDTTAIREFEAFVDAAVTAARQGENLPHNWAASDITAVV